jgi:hypothetical protein
MKTKFRLTFPHEMEAMVGPIPVAVECNIEVRMLREYEKPVYYPNDDAYPGYEGYEVLNVLSVDAMVDWYTPAPDGTMTVYHYVCFSLEGFDAQVWLDAWGVDVPAAVDAYDVAAVYKEEIE